MAEIKSLEALAVERARAVLDAKIKKAMRQWENVFNTKRNLNKGPENERHKIHLSQGAWKPLCMEAMAQSVLQDRFPLVG